MSRNVIDDFEDLINRKAKMLAEINDLEAEIEARAPDVIRRAGENDEPVDVSKVLAKIGAGVSVDVIEGGELPLDEEDIDTFHGEITSDVRAKQKRRRQILMAAASAVAGTASKAAFGV